MGGFSSSFKHVLGLEMFQLPMFFKKDLTSTLVLKEENETLFYLIIFTLLFGFNFFLLVVLSLVLD